MTKETKKKKVKEIENSVKDDFLLEMYRSNLEGIEDINIQNEWLDTKEGQNCVGSDQVEELRAKNNIKKQQLESRTKLLKAKLTK